MRNALLFLILVLLCGCGTAPAPAPIYLGHVATTSGAMATPTTRMVRAPSHVMRIAGTNAATMYVTP